MHEELIKLMSKITEEEKNIILGRNGIDQQLYTEKKEMIVDSEKLLKKGKLIEVRPHTRFIDFPKHKHNYVEVIYMCKGSTTHILDGNEVVLQEGDLLFLNQNAEQEVRAADSEDIAVNFIVRPEFFNMAFSMMEEEENTLREFLVEALCGKSGNTSYLYFHVADILPIQNLVENMVWTIVYDQPNKRQCNQITMGLLILQLLNHMDKMEFGNCSYDREVMGNVLNYIEEHYKTGSLTEMAEMTGYKAYWLSRQIKQQTGKTYKELLLEKRLSHSAYLLANTSIPVADIIEMVGYDNSSYFYRRFRERYGTTPKEYRAQSEQQDVQQADQQNEQQAEQQE